jgi:integrase/recombinase XerD
MLEDYSVKPSTIDRVRSSWLAPQIESYLEWLQAHGYSRLVVYRRLPLLFHSAEFAQKKGCRDIASCKAYIQGVRTAVVGTTWSQSDDSRCSTQA